MVPAVPAVIDRIDAALADVGRRKLTRMQSALLAPGILIVAGGFSRVGLIDLIAKGYTAMAYGFLALVAFPLLTVGVYRIWKPRQEHRAAN